MQELPGSTTTNCHPQQPTGATTNATPVDPTITKSAENDSTTTPAASATNGNGTVKEKAPPKKKKANPVYITPVRRERKRSCSDSDNEGYIPGGDSDWAPGKKKSKSAKKKVKSKKAKSPQL